MSVSIARARKSLNNVRIGLAVILLASAVAVAQDATLTGSHFTTIDPPGAISTECNGVNNRGDIVGDYSDANFTAHGFVRDSRGKFTVIDIADNQGIRPAGINIEREVAGSYSTIFDVHGFVWYNGKTTTFDPPNSLGISVQSINDQGQVTGNFQDGNVINTFPVGDPYVNRGFVRNRHGNFTIFDVPGVSISSNPQSINDFGDIAGYYFDQNLKQRGFVRDRYGRFTTFDGTPAAIQTSALSINNEGNVTGFYRDANRVPHSYVRSRVGTIKTFDPPGSATGSFGSSLNDLGVSTGIYADFTRGYARIPSGAIVPFRVPGSTSTQPAQNRGINLFGTITGQYTDSAGATHGFVLK